MHLRANLLSHLIVLSRTDFHDKTDVWRQLRHILYAPDSENKTISQLRHYPQDISRTAMIESLPLASVGVGSMSKLATRFTLFILVVVMLSSLYLSWSTERGLGDLVVEDHVIERPNGRTVHFSVYRPRQPDYGKPLPCVVTIHGISGSRDMMSPYSIELARRNFTVVAVDLAGHGVSEEKFGFAEFPEVIDDVYAAVEYIQTTIPNVNSTHYGVLGHSLGAGIALYLQNAPIRPASTVIIGGGMGQDFGADGPVINTTTPSNLMIASGTYDELVSVELAIQTLRNATGLEDAETGVTYGSFAAGTARKLVFSATNHLFEVSDSVLVGASVDWLVRSLQGNSSIISTLDPSQQIYGYRELGNALVSASVLLTVFPLFSLAYPFVSSRFDLSTGHSSHMKSEEKRRYLYSVILGLLGGAFLLVSFLAGFGFEFAGIRLVPVSFGTSIALYALIMLLMVGLLSRSLLGKKPALQNALAPTTREILVGALSAGILGGWCLFWSWFGSEVFGLQSMIGVSVVRPIGQLRLVYSILLTLPLLCLFYAEDLWLNSIEDISSRPTSTEQWIRSSLGVLALRLTGLLIVLGVLYVPFLAGIRFGFVMFIALLMLPFVLLVGLNTLYTVWMGKTSGNRVAAIVFNAFLIALVVAGTFQLV
ncbi:alpha/beta fold hydrolase [Candidatus Thorarchaeota archaeon]|nr:MAG: alpha/beta fold hydrolase [Candidatus Thorarchaeota archaeon]